jgi:chemotaxis signal transduction protein
MKNTLRISLALLAVATMSVGATVMSHRAKKNTHPVEIPVTTSKVVGVKNYQGQLIPVVQLPELTVSGSAIKKSK